MNEEKNQTPVTEENELPVEAKQEIEQQEELTQEPAAEAEIEGALVEPAESEQAENEQEVPAEAAPEPEAPVAPEKEPTVVYRWNYGAQKQYDEALRRKKAGKGSRFAFIGIVSCAFLIVIRLLIGVLVFRDTLSVSGQTVNTVKIAEKLLPSTVLVSAKKGSVGTAGSGFFVRQDGLIVTNYHVVNGADSIQVKLYGSDQKIDATLVGFNGKCDLAVLKIPGFGYPAVTFGDSSALRIGEPAIAIGNPEGEDAEWSVTQGIISSNSRKVLASTDTEIVELHMIQTDAAVNPGSSGCLLCNQKGEVIGIITRKQIYRTLVTSTDDTVTVFDEGVGYAIPGNGAQAVIKAIVEMKSVDLVSVGLMRVRPKIGISVMTIKKGEKLIDEQTIEAPADGILVASVSENGANGLLEAGDIIVKFDGMRVTESEKVIEMLYSYKRGDKVKVVFYKNGEFYESEVELTLGVFS